jgi:hypothetical protein
MRLLVGVMVAAGVVAAALPSGGIGVLVIMAIMGGLLLAGNERTCVVASTEGIRSVPMFGREKRYAWSEINGFSVQQVLGGRYGGPAVSVSLTDRSVVLRPTLARGGKPVSVRPTCDALNAELERWREGRPVG